MRRLPAGHWRTPRPATRITPDLCGAEYGVATSIRHSDDRGGTGLTPTPPAELAAGIDYFFAVRPDGHARVEIANAAARFRRSQRASGVPVSVDNLHLALCPMGRPERPQLSLERAMLAAGAAVRGNAFTVTLDAAMRCIPTGGQFPFVLCADPVTAVAALELRKAIAAAQRVQGLQVHGVSSFHPHVALQHGPAIDAIEESISPIQWRADPQLLRPSQPRSGRALAASERTCAGNDRPAGRTGQHAGLAGLARRVRPSRRISRLAVPRGPAACLRAAVVPARVRAGRCRGWRR